jgi:Na+/melibiose symporter-like transporter
MSRRSLTATLLNWLVVAVMFGAGVHYLTSTQVMPYHQQAMDVCWTELTPRCRMLVLSLMKGTGMVGISTAVSLAVLLAVPFRRREKWSRWAILIVGATVLVPMLYGAIRLRVETGAATPWWGCAALLVILCLAFWLARDFEHVR